MRLRDLRSEVLDDILASGYEGGGALEAAMVLAWGVNTAAETIGKALYALGTSVEESTACISCSIDRVCEPLQNIAAMIDAHK